MLVKCIKGTKRLKENVAYRIECVTISSSGEELLQVSGLPGWYCAKRFQKVDTLDRFLMMRPALKGRKGRWRR